MENNAQNTASQTPPVVTNATPPATAPINPTPDASVPLSQQEQPTAPVAPVAPTEPLPQPSAPQAPIQPTPAIPTPAPASVEPQAPIAPVQPSAPLTPPVAPNDELPAQHSSGNLPPIREAIQPETQVQEQPTAPAFSRVAPASAPVIENPGERYLRDKARTPRALEMQKILAAQPKVMTMIPKEPGEKEGTMHYVGINGYSLWIRKGVMLPVPQQVAEMIAESFNLTAQIHREASYDDAEARANALQ